MVEAAKAPTNGDSHPIDVDALPGLPEGFGKLKHFVETGEFDDIFKFGDGDNALSKLLEPGGDTRSDPLLGLYMRAYFLDPKHANACVMLGSIYEEMGDKEGVKMVHRHVAAFVAIKGRRAQLAVDAITAGGKSDSDSLFGGAKDRLARAFRGRD